MEYVIAELILEHKKALSWQALENAIEAANHSRLEQLRSNGSRLVRDEQNRTSTKSRKAKTRPKAAKTDADPKELKGTIDRRKLQSLAEGDPSVSLNQYEFELLDTFFRRDGDPGLAETPLFRRKVDLFQVLNKADRVSFFVGVRNVKALNSDMIARWDVSALDTMREQLPATVGSESFVIATRDVVHQLDRKEWDTLRNQASGNVIVSIASPIACAGTERQMAQIFDIPAYKSRAIPAPVCFAHANASYESAFVRDPREIAGLTNGKAALLVNGEIYVSGRGGRDYGVVIGQRTGHEHATFVVAGVGGPGTLGAANFFANGQISVTLPRYSKKEKQPIVVAVIATQIRRAEAPADRRIDMRAVADTRLARRPLQLEHIKGEWVVTSE